MSYDLYVFRVPAGGSVEDVFDQEMSIEEDGGETNDDAELDRCYEHVEQALGEAGSCYRCGGHISINIPYHHQGAEAQRLYGRVAECLHRARLQHGLTIYDPQEGRAIDPQRDLGSMLAGNERGTKIVREIQHRPIASASPAHSTSKPKKPWWRFW